VPPPPRAEDAEAAELAAALRRDGGTLVATGGCFDVLHAGHVATLEAAARLGDGLVVLLNSDASVRRLKGPDRPVQSADDRARVLLGLRSVDAVLVFDEDDPRTVLDRLRPDIWAKGGDYDASCLPELDLVRSWGGRVVLLPYLAGRSTTAILNTTS
jgi:rfaE bifunctional protein nucleotidyltransferase chain/domain